MIDNPADNGFVCTGLRLIGYQIEEPAIFQVINAVALHNNVPVCMAERDAAVAVPDRPPTRMTTHRQWQWFRDISLIINFGTQTLPPIDIVSFLAVGGEGIGNRIQR